MLPRIDLRDFTITGQFGMPRSIATDIWMPIEPACALDQGLNEVRPVRRCAGVSCGVGAASKGVWFCLVRTTWPEAATSMARSELWRNARGPRRGTGRFAKAMGVSIEELVGERIAPGIPIEELVAGAKKAGKAKK
jgi:hypothetical protein